MKIQINKEKVKAAAQEIVDYILNKREKLKQEAIEIFSQYSKPRFPFDFWSKNKYTKEDFEEISRRPWDYSFTPFDKLSSSQKYCADWAEGSLNLANDIIFACNSTETDYIILNNKEIEFFNRWGINFEK